MIAFLRYVRALRIALFGVPSNDCRHEWRQTSKIAVYQNETDQRPVRFDYVLTCNRCGDMKIFKA